MALNIFRTAEEQTPRVNLYEGIVGSFRAGYLDNGKPMSCEAWRVTTGDPEVAAAIHKLLGGDAPAEWETKGEEGLEVYTAAKSVPIILDGPTAVRQRFVQRNRNNEVVYTSDGTFKDDGERDPHAALPLEERLKLASDNLGPALETSLFFKLDDSLGDCVLGGQRAQAGDIGKFSYRSAGKSIGMQIDRDQVEQQLADYGAPGRAKLTIEHVSFIAKSGPRAGKAVEYNTAVLKLLGAVA